MEENVNLFKWSCMKMCDIFIFSNDHYFNLSILFHHCDQAQRFGSLFNTIRNNTFLCFVCCSLGDIFNFVPCFQICMLPAVMAFNVGPPCHADIKKCHFFTQVWNADSPPWNVIEAAQTPMLYTASRFIVQGYSPHKCIKCVYCVHSNRTKKSPTLAWS